MKQVWKILCNSWLLQIVEINKCCQMQISRTYLKGTAHRCRVIEMMLWSKWVFGLAVWDADRCVRLGISFSENSDEKRGASFRYKNLLRGTLLLNVMWLTHTIPYTSDHNHATCITNFLHPNFIIIFHFSFNFIFASSLSSTFVFPPINQQIYGAKKSLSKTFIFYFFFRFFIYI